MMAGKRIFPRSFNAVIVQSCPVPATSRGGFTNPSDQRAYLVCEKQKRQNVSFVFKLDVLKTKSSNE